MPQAKEWEEVTVMTACGQDLSVLRRKQPLDALAELVRAAKGKPCCASSGRPALHQGSQSDPNPLMEVYRAGSQGGLLANSNGAPTHSSACMHVQGPTGEPGPL